MPRPIINLIKRFYEADVLTQAMVIGAVTALTYLMVSKALSGELKGMRVEEIARALGARRFRITWSG